MAWYGLLMAFLLACGRDSRWFLAAAIGALAHGFILATAVERTPSWECWDEQTLN